MIWAVIAFVALPLIFMCLLIAMINDILTPRHACGCVIGKGMTKRCSKTGLHPRRMVGKGYTWEP